MTLFNDKAELPLSIGQIIIGKSIRVQEYNNQLSLVATQVHSEIILDDRILKWERYWKIQEWISTTGASTDLVKI